MAWSGERTPPDRPPIRARTIGPMPIATRHVPRLNPAEAAAAEESAHKVVETHRALAAFLRSGQTLAQIDTFVAQTLDSLDCRSCFLGYRVPRTPPFPSHACLSVNDCVVHGTAGYLTRPLAPGDVLKIDIGVTYRGWIGDAAWTYSIGKPSPVIRRLMDTGKESLRRGIAALKIGGTLLEWAKAVQGYVEGEAGFHLVRGLGGHGYGRRLHGPPYVSNTLPTYSGEWPDAQVVLEPGILMALEPMIAAGTPIVNSKKGTWPVFTEDASMSVHHEHDVLMTDDGPKVLTAGLEELPDVIDA